MALPDIILHEQLGIDRAQDGVLGGVPIPRGELQAGGWFDLRRSDGGTHVVEGAPAAYWPDGSVKWLHLCGHVDLQGGAANRFTMEPATEVPDGALTVESVTPHCLRITGGMLDVQLRTDVLNMLAVRDTATGAELLLPPGLSVTYQLATPDESSWRECRFEFVREPIGVVVQTANRVVLRLAGRVLDHGAREVAQIRLFVEIWRESRELRVQPVLIPIGLPDEEKIRAFHLTVHSAYRSGDRSYRFGDAQGPGQVDPVHPHFELGPRWPQARQVQLGSSFYKTEKRTCEPASWTKIVEGGRAQGWCHLHSESGGITGAMRYYWQEYPHSLQVDADAGTLTFGLIPVEAEPLDLRRYSPTLHGGGDGNVSMYEYGTGPDEPQLSGARGIAKAHELAIRFHAADDTDIARQALSFLAPCRPIAAPADFTSSRVVGHVGAYDASHTADDAAGRIMDFLIAERDVRGWYGLMDFGDVMLSYYSDTDRWGFDDGGHAWLNTENLPDYGMWLSALRAGRADWLEASIEMTRHNRDVDTYHWGELKGLGTRHNVNHWGCRDKEWRVTMPLVRRLHYYTTADPWTREVIMSMVDMVQSWERTKRIAPGMTAGLAAVHVKWEITGAPEDAQAVANLADCFAAMVQDDGAFLDKIHIDFATGEGHPVGDTPFALTNLFFLDSFGGQQVLAELAELLDHEALTAAIVRHADLRLRLAADADMVEACQASAEAGVGWLAVALRATGDERYRAPLKQALGEIAFALESTGGDGILDAPRHDRPPEETRRNKYTCGLGRLLYRTAFMRAEA